MKLDQTIDADNQRLVKHEIEHWRQVLERLIGLVKIHATQNLAFRGSSDNLFEANNGNFFKFVEFLATFDPIMKEHVRRIRSAEIHFYYAGKNIQNEIIELLASKVKFNILADAKSAKYFSIIVDCTPDASHVEQMTLIIRFTTCTEADQTQQAKVCIREHFIDFVSLQDTTGAGMTDVILNKIQNHGLVLENLRGQSYDNGANMKGKHNGVQRKILDLNPRAFFVPCNAHTLNLVVNDAANCCTEVVKFFGIIQSVCVFLSVYSSLGYSKKSYFDSNC